ncbi:MAG: hypothetical protein U1C96_09815 [Gallionella sp.]|nr:hypothetical protein [Gallionella sp.]
MRFIVRYGSSALPTEFRNADGSLRLLDYSIHPPTRLGLHNAMFVCNDRREILETYGGTYECEVYVVEGMNSQMLTQELAIKLFNALPSGEVKWITIREFLQPRQDSTGAACSPQDQLHLFEYTHQPDDEIPTHHFDADA